MTWLQEFAKYWEEYATTDAQFLDPEYVTYDMHGFPEKSAWGFMRWLADKAEQPEPDDGGGFND